MLLHHLDQGGMVETTFRHPSRELAMPNQVMAMYLDAVRSGIVDVSIGICEAGVATGWLGDFPLLSILGGDAANRVSCLAKAWQSRTEIRTS